MGRSRKARRGVAGEPSLVTMLLASPYASVVGRVRVRQLEIVVRGARTRLWEYGEPGSSCHVVLLHGLRGDHHGLEPIAAFLDGCRVTVPDLPGFGTSKPLTADRHDVAGYGAWARELIAAVAPTGDLVLAGHSFGSVIAAAALASGSAAHALVLLSPIVTAPLHGPHPVLTQLTVLHHRLGAALPERAGTALLRSRVATRLASVAMARTRDRALRRWIHAEHARFFNGFADHRVLLEAFHASLTEDVARYAAEIAQPVLLVAGQEDDLAPLPALRQVGARFPDARLVVIGGSGHLTHYEEPAAVARSVADFLRAWVPPR